MEIELAGHAAILDRPRGARALLVLAHGAGAGMRHPFLADVAAALVERKIATLRWEFPYMTAGKRRAGRPRAPGQAGRAPPPADIAEASVRAVWTAARSRYRTLPMFAGGKSFGGRMTSRAHAAAPLPDLRGLVFLGFPLHPPDKPAIERAEHLAQAAGPMLFLQGTRDDLADLVLLRPIIKRLGARATLHVVEGADHGFDVLVRSGRTRDEVLAELASSIAAWIAGRS